MTKYHFVLWLDDAGAITADLEDRVYEAGCGDALLGIFHRKMFLEFDREAESLLRAVSSAVRDARSAGLSVDNIGLDVEDLVTQAEISRKSGRTPASVSHLILGQRGPGNFPAPIHVVGNTNVWFWSEVKEWFAAYDGSLPPCGEALELQAIASAYRLVRSTPDKLRRDRIVDEIACAVG